MAIFSCKLIPLPSSWVFSEQAWQVILAKVSDGATLLVSGRLDADEHFHPTARTRELGFDLQPGLLATRENSITWPDGEALLSYSIPARRRLGSPARLEPGRPALLLVSDKGELLASYNW